METGILVLTVLMILIVANGLKIAAESERFVVIVAGRFAKLVGPGLLFRLPGSLSKWTRIKLGDTGRYLGDGISEIHGVSFPVTVRNVRPGELVKVTSFEDSQVCVSRAS